MSNPPVTLESLEDRKLFSNSVLQWNSVALDAIRALGTPPPLAARDLAMVHIAIADAVDGIVPSFDSYLPGKGGPRGASIDAAVASAAHDVLSSVFPAQARAFDSDLKAALATIPDGPAQNSGVAFGRQEARRVLADRLHDGADAVAPYTIGTAPGDWQPTPPGYQQTPLFPQWPQVKPFAMPDAAQFSPSGPPALDSEAYAQAFDEVKSLGSKTSSTRTADQTQIALFWADGAGTATPPGHWNQIAQVVAEARHDTVVQDARLFALLNVAMADAGIVAWSCKYQFNFWRPVTAIRAADQDGNPATDADPNWTPLITTPAFPSYVSGHSSFSAAAAAILAGFFGTDHVAFTAGDDGMPGVTRTFESFSQAAAEAGMSRVYGGIHWQFDNADALASCSSLGTYVFDHYFAPDSKPIVLPPKTNAATPPADSAAEPRFNGVQLITDDPFFGRGGGIYNDSEAETVPGIIHRRLHGA
jgi:membrane-associated phospholipid phosphatase